MVPKTTSGASFARAGAYFLHDKGAHTAERVEWAQTLNLRTDNPSLALGIMGWTARHADERKQAAGVPMTGQKLDKPVLQFSLSWHPEQQPGRAEMMEAARQALQAIAMHDRQAVIVCHGDQPQPHIHVIVNRVCPETGRAASDSHIHLRLSKWAEKWERDHGKIYCQERVNNNRERENGAFIKGRDGVIQLAWNISDNGRAFAAALQTQGYVLARGDKRDFVIVDPQGKTINPARAIEGAKAKDIRAKLADLKADQLPTVAQARKDKQTPVPPREEQARAVGKEDAARSKQSPEVWDRDEDAARREISLSDAALAAAAKAAETVQREKDQQAAPVRPAKLDPAPRHRFHMTRRTWEELREAKEARPPQFEAWKNRSRARLQGYFLSERTELDRTHARQMDALSERLEAVYGKGLREVRQRLAEIEQRQQRGGFLYRITGKASADRHAAAAARLTLVDIEQRMAEQVGALKAQQRERTDRHDQRERQTSKRLETRIAGLVRANQNTPEPPKAEPQRINVLDYVRQAQERDRQHDQGEGPDFERDRGRDFER